jgi:hypothetical protein
MIGIVEAEDSNVQNKSTNGDDAGGEGGVGEERGEPHEGFPFRHDISLSLSHSFYNTAPHSYCTSSSYRQSSNYGFTLLLHLSVREGC